MDLTELLNLRKLTLIPSPAVQALVKVKKQKQLRSLEATGQVDAAESPTPWVRTITTLKAWDGFQVSPSKCSYVGPMTQC
jgi:hypothetical protein